MNKILVRLFLTNLIVIFFSFLVFGILFRISFPQYISFLELGVFLALFLSLVVGRIFLKPIRQIKKAAQKIIQGDFKSRLSMSRKDELGDLADHLNHMSGELQNKISEILQDQNELKAILSSMVEGVLVIDKDERIVLLNWPVYEMLDLRSKDTVGRHYWEVIRNEEINSLLKEAITQKKSLKKEIMIIAPSESHFSMQVSCVFTDRGVLSAVVSVFHDISELKKLAKLRSEFVANASHELKTPLTTIKGFVETLKDGAIHNEQKAQKFLDIIAKHTQRLEELVGDLLSLSAIESKEVKLDFAKVQIAAVLESVVNLAKERWDTSQYKIILDVSQNFPAVSLDRSRMEQAFLNLLDNAIKFTPAGGVITISAYQENGFSRIDFKDTGIGIEPEHIPRIFERFYRVDKGRSRELGGTGLGLSIVKHIVQAHQGKVLVQSEVGKGSVFSIFLPY